MNDGSNNINWQRVFGQSNSAGNSRFQIQMNNSNASNWYFNIAGVSKTFTLNTTSGFQTFKFESGIGIYLNGVLSQSFNNTETNNYSIWLFRGYDKYSSLKISRAKLWQSSTLVRDFIPCYKKVGSVPGFYDLINGKFYENKGTGTFVLGPSI